MSFIDRYSKDNTFELAENNQNFFRFVPPALSRLGPPLSLQVRFGSKMNPKATLK